MNENNWRVIPNYFKNDTLRMEYKIETVNDTEYIKTRYVSYMDEIVSTKEYPVSEIQLLMNLILSCKLEEKYPHVNLDSCTR